jgi:hypothetical protein
MGNAAMQHLHGFVHEIFKYLQRVRPNFNHLENIPLPLAAQTTSYAQR